MWQYLFALGFGTQGAVIFYFHVFRTTEFCRRLRLSFARSSLSSSGKTLSLHEPSNTLG